VITAKAAAGNSQLPSLIFPPNKRHELVKDVSFVLQVPNHSNARVDPFVVPTLRVHGIGAEHLQFAAFDFWSEGTDHSTILVLEKFSHRCGEHEKWSSSMAENERFHVAVQFLAVTLVIFAIHQVW
jgi:hypothetical protein